MLRWFACFRSPSPNPTLRLDSDGKVAFSNAVLVISNLVFD